jgi:hypothetical protein
MGSPAKAAAIAAMVWFVGLSAASAQVVVLNAKGPSSAAYPQGAVLAPGRVISLKAGDQLEVLDAAGSHVLNGPASLQAGQISAGSKAALQDVFRRANASRPGIAAVRGFTLDDGKTPAPTDVPPLWRLDIVSWQQGEPSDPRNFCVVHGQIPVLTRDTTASEGRLAIYQDSTHVSRILTWPAGLRDIAWPNNLPYADGDLFSLNLDDAGATTVRWRTVPAESADLTALATALLDNGCYDQLDSLQTQVAGK